MPFEPKWEVSNHPARLWSKNGDGVTCHLSPRNCKIREGRYGFCGVRQNVGGELVTLNYGRATHITQESIETEAVFHYAPGAPILSLGNVGCMMNCDYCHNWKTSQARFVEGKDVHTYTPQQVVDIALERGIPVISWTYNDPVVWHEFVLDTGRLARRHGIKNLFKSAFFISMDGAAELCEVIDIFSVSVKTMDEQLYRRISKGWLPPVLEATKYVFAQGKHVEVSNLMVTDSNDSEEHARAIIEWVLENLSPSTPLHFVRFHPDYRYTHVGRTPIERLTRARELALEMGIKYCYVGNVYGHEGSNTICPGCKGLLVERFGLTTWPRGLAPDGSCLHCGMPQDFVQLPERPKPKVEVAFAGFTPDQLKERSYEWRGDINSCHLEIANEGGVTQAIYYWRLQPNGESVGPFGNHVNAGDSFRFIISKETPNEVGLKIQHPPAVNLKLFEVYDRAHFPTQDVDSGVAPDDRVPLPFYQKPSQLAVVE